MADTATLLQQVDMGLLHDIYPSLYGNNFNIVSIDERYKNLIITHRDLFQSHTNSHSDLHLFSTAGRTELAGNHTDHNHGKVIAGTINLDTIAAVQKTDDNMVTLISEGFPPVQVDLSSLEKQQDELYTTNALLRGIADAFVQRGLAIGGWIANTTTNVLKGSGLSSSAAIEVLCATIFNCLYNDEALSPVELAIIGKYAENEYFGKPSGLMDQVACGQGGIVGIDFKDPASPAITPLDFSFTDYGYHLVIVDTKGNHADLTPDYAGAPIEMKAVAAYFGKEVLREVDFDQFLKEIPQLRKELHNDRAILRAYHFFMENIRVETMLKALKDKDIETYLHLVQESGNSSYKFLQNLYSSSHPQEQGLPIALALSEHLLQGKGACRVHGGGFAGTIQAYIPTDLLEAYCNQMKQVFGEDAVTLIAMRSLKTSMLV